MKKNWKIISVILIFAAIIGANLLISVSYMVRPIDGKRKRITGYYAEPEDSLDVIVLGGSAVYRYINNPLLWNEEQITSYSFATPGLDIFTLEYLVEEALKTQTPEVLIIDARKFHLQEDASYKADRFEEMVDNLKYSSTRVRMINRLIEDPKERFYYYFDILKYYDNWEGFTEERLEYADNEKEHITKAWVIVTDVAEVKAVDVSDVTEKEPLSPVAEETLISLLEKCQKECNKKGIEVLFLATPWQISDAKQKRSNYMKDLVEEYGFDYLDMNPVIEEIGIDFSTDFYNGRHVNVIGADKVTNYLADYLTENYVFSGNHDDEVITAWNECFKITSEKTEEKLNKNK